MNISQLKSEYDVRGKGFYNFIKFNYPDIYSTIKNNDGRNMSESFYLYINNTTPITCKVCNDKSARFISVKDGYSDYCNKKCYEKVHGETIRLIAKSGAYKNVGTKARDTYLKNHNNYDKIVDRVKNTKLQKYNDPTYNNREKYINTMVSRYGTTTHPNTITAFNKLHENNIIGFKSDKYKQYLDSNSVTNVSQMQSVRNIVIQKRRNREIDYIFNGNRLSGLVTPLFEREEFSGNKAYYKFKCNTCNHTFKDRMINGRIPRCKKCFPLYKGKSRIQESIFEFIKSIYSDSIIYNDRSLGIEIDIFIPTLKLGIELNGTYWHSELCGKDKNYHLNKTLICNNNGIRLIHIFDDEWIDKNEIIKCKLSHILNKSNEDIYARKCVISDIDSKTKKQFLIENHIQGNDNSKIRLGAYYNNQLVAVMTFGGYRTALGNSHKNNEYEMYRFCMKGNVVGIAGKLFKHFIKVYNPKKVITYADRRWSDGNLYEKIGFTKISNGKPNYWYLDKSYNRIHRYSFRKNVLSTKLDVFDNSLTEWENMKLNGYNRIWDCGHLKYEYNN